MLAILAALLSSSGVASGTFSGTPPPPAGELYVRAATIYLDGERVLTDGVLFVEDGRIRSVGRGVEVPAGAPLVEHAGVLTAGLVSCAARLGPDEELHDSTRALLPEARAADAFAPGHSDFSRTAPYGITSAVLIPSPAGVAGGVSAVVRADGSGFLAREGHLTLSLSSEALQQTREPTSYPGALAALREALAEPAGVWSEAAAGRLPVLVYAGPRHQVARAVDFIRAHDLAGAVVGAPLAGELAPLLREAELGVVLPPLGPGTPRRVLDSVLALSDAGVPFAFGSTDPGSGIDPLRFSAALCVRHGLDPLAAWRALTADAARLAGVDERVGTLESGKEADFVLWDGDPLELKSSPEAVYVAGRRVFGGRR